jgi:hypothetical protein
MVPLEQFALMLRSIAAQGTHAPTSSKGCDASRSLGERNGSSSSFETSARAFELRNIFGMRAPQAEDEPA